MITHDLDKFCPGGRKTNSESIEWREECGRTRHGELLKRKVVPMRVTCPVCKRRFRGYKMFDHDSCFCGYFVPQHKARKVVKKRKRVSRETLTRTRSRAR